MTSEHVDAAFTALETILHDKKKKRPKEITLYGGEPLIAKNFEVVAYIVDRAINQNFEVRAITNG